MSQEKNSSFQQHERNVHIPERQDLQERIKEHLEKAGEQSHEISATEARDHAHEAITEASERERVTVEQQSTKSERATPEKQLSPAAARTHAYHTTMKQVRSELPASSRAFSHVIHNPIVEKTSDAVGGTIARPNAILSGSIMAFIFTIAIYLIAKYYGYPLSGTETMASFVIGWVVGLIIDYARLLLGKR